MNKRVLAWALALLMLTGCGARADTAQNITAQARISASTGEISAMTDKSIKTYWRAERDDATIAIDVPENATPGGLSVEWFVEPKDYEITEYDASGAVLAAHVPGDTFPCISQFLPLDSRTARITLRVPSGTKISSLRLSSQGDLPENVAQWQPPVKKADIMFVSTHQDDELLWFGGAIPYYAVERQANVVVTYMTSCGRARRGEALNGLWVMGVRNYPEFLNLKDKFVRNYDAGLSLWGGKDAIIEKLADAIRKYRPEVIVTHDLNGEYGHKQHIITATLMREAIDAAADPARCADSAARYGAWQVKKLYLHLYAENALTMDWNTPSERLNGMTPMQAARLGFAQHKSQQKKYDIKRDGKKYDNRKFGLAYTTVGLDTAKNDFLENIPPAPVDTPAPTVAPTIMPTAMPTVMPTVAPAATSAPVPPAQEKRSSNALWLALGGAVLLGGGALLYARAQRARTRHRKKRAAR